jgi:uncharacterized protein YjbI with pentapeptide repeats
MEGGRPACDRTPACPATVVAGYRQCWSHLSVEDFADALDGLTPGADLDLRGTVAGTSLLSDILPRLRDASGELRIGSLNWDRVAFSSHVELRKVSFSGKATFTHCNFSQGATFATIRFADQADFSNATFGGPAILADVEFARDALFRECMFTEAKLSHIIAGKNISFEKANVSRLTISDAQSPSGSLTLSGLRATEDGEVEVKARFSAVRCKQAEFGGPARLQLATGPLWLTGSTFKGTAIVESWLPALAKEPGRANEPLLPIRSLRGVDAERLTLTDVDLSQCLMYGLRRPEELRLEGRWLFPRTPRGWHPRHGLPWRWTRRDALYEEHLWRGWAIATKDAEDPIDLDDPAMPCPPARLAVLYRQLRQGVEDARNAPGAADLYYGEMEMRRLSTDALDERALLTAYWLVSGYGLRASRALLLLAGVVLAATEVLQHAGFGRASHHPGFVDSLLYTAGSLLSLTISGHLPTTLSDWGQAMVISLRITGPVLLGLAALAMRGRLTR